MRSIEHFRHSAETDGYLVGALSTMPDVFQLGKYVPNAEFRRFCMNMHNTDQAVEAMNNIHPKLGRAWELHREQDLATHDFTYEYQHRDWSKEVPEDSVLMMSGGLDSFIAWRLLDQPKAVYFDIGNRASEKERAMVERIRDDFQGDITIDDRLQLADIEMPNGYIPYRNLFFIMMATYQSPNVVISQIAEWAPDKNQQFYRQTEKMLGNITKGAFQQLEGQDIKIYAPFNKMTKTKMVKEYAERFDPAELTEYTTSCYSNSEVNCGECTACASRFIAMENNDIHEEYAQEPDITKFRQKLSLKDFDPKQAQMYIQRYFEMRKYL